jgi:hypothetical protein
VATGGGVSEADRIRGTLANGIQGCRCQGRKGQAYDKIRWCLPGDDHIPEVPRGQGQHPQHLSNKLDAIRPYLWNTTQQRWEEGRWSFYNRAAYNHPTIPYEAFKEGLAKWFDATPEAEESHIRENIKAAAGHKDVNKDVTILHPDADEEKIAQYFASKHNTGNFSAIKGEYATKFVEHWKKVKWNFKCGTDPRNRTPSEREPKEAQA